jgi:hypothetical protein
VTTIFFGTFFLLSYHPIKQALGQHHFHLATLNHVEGHIP